VPPPPNNAAANPPESGPDATTREAVATLTEQEGSACAGCHASVINPLGFATENFDPLGRPRTEEMLFDADGNMIGTKPIDTTSVPLITAGDETASSGAGDLTQLVLGSGKAQACLARNLVRFSMARQEDLEGDGCMLSETANQLVDGATMREVLRTVALRPEFRQRQFEE
jgi:hypothetical protein